MNINKLIDILVKKYHQSNFEGTPIICWENDKAVINWYEDGICKEVIEIDIQEKIKTAELYGVLRERINFIEISYTLREKYLK